MQITAMLSASETMVLIIKTSVMVFDGYVLSSWLFCLSMPENITGNRCLMTKQFQMKPSGIDYVT